MRRLRVTPKVTPSFVQEQRVAEGCHPVTPVTRISASQPKANFEGSQPDTHSEVDSLGTRDSAEKVHFQKLEGWKIRYLERAGLREFDGNLTRTHADRAAWRDIVAEWAELHGADRQEAEAAMIALGMTPTPG